MNNLDNHVYDKAKWHYGADDFPHDLPAQYGFVHMGFFLTWLAERSLLSDFVIEETANDIEMVLVRSQSPIHLLEVWDGVLIGEMISKLGNKFAIKYYEKKYFSDFVDVLFDDVSNDNVYTVEPSWKNYDLVKPVLNQRYQKWTKSVGKLRWQFWK